jgi:hypothetical protein
MAVQAFRNLIPRGELLGVAALVIIGVALIVLAPALGFCPQESNTEDNQIPWTTV